jgi:8-oxo-dGTP pyrophosphatase MutT (NUDIX family)
MQNAQGKMVTKLCSRPPSNAPRSVRESSSLEEVSGDSVCIVHFAFDDVLTRLQVGLARPLPGAVAQARMAPRPRGNWPPEFDPAHIRHAAGLLLVFPIGSDAHVVLTVRADTLGRHGGQVSLPGGVVEPGESFERTALREAYEEVALAPDQVRILGALTPLDIPVSGFRLHPIVAAAAVRPLLTPSDGEVALILEVAVADLWDPARRISIARIRDERELVVPAFEVAGVEIWGATAMVLAEFLAVLGWTPEVP